MADNAWYKSLMKQGSFQEIVKEASLDTFDDLTAEELAALASSVELELSAYGLDLEHSAADGEDGNVSPAQRELIDQRNENAAANPKGNQPPNPAQDPETPPGSTKDGVFDIPAATQVTDEETEDEKSASDQLLSTLAQTEAIEESLTAEAEEAEAYIETLAMERANEMIQEADAIGKFAQEIQGVLEEYGVGESMASLLADEIVKEALVSDDAVKTASALIPDVLEVTASTLAPAMDDEFAHRVAAYRAQLRAQLG